LVFGIILFNLLGLDGDLGAFLLLHRGSCTHYLGDDRGEEAPGSPRASRELVLGCGGPPSSEVRTSSSLSSTTCTCSAAASFRRRRHPGAPFCSRLPGRATVSGESSGAACVGFVCFTSAPPAPSPSPTPHSAFYSAWELKAPLSLRAYSASADNLALALTGQVDLPVGPFAGTQYASCVTDLPLRPATTPRMN
jgi:hypothetical protein